MPSLLKVVATPIGNVKDISLRAIEAIENADVIFAEDTRHCLKLVNALAITLKAGCALISCHAQREVQRINLIVEKLQTHENVVFLSDAGCPTISDPGSLAVQGVIKAGFSVEIIPGPSAHSAALMGAGIDTTRFAFLGFLPQRPSHRKTLIVTAAQAGLALVFYESPLRVNKLLAELYQLLGERRVVVGRELTKVFETFHRGGLGSALHPPLVELGECVVVVEAAHKPLPLPLTEGSQPTIVDFITQGLTRGTSAKDLAREAAELFRLKKKQAYSLVVSTRHDLERA